MLNPDDLRLFLTILREGNMLAAARRVGMDHSTVARRIGQLETALAVRLFDRSPRGVTPTQAAFALQPHAERIESELLAAAASVRDRDRAVDGTVRLATPEAFASHLLAPRAAQLRDRHPGLVLELASESRTNSLSRREADMAVMLKPPPRGRLVTRKLADYQLGLFASRAYLDRHGAPETRAQLYDHVFISYIEELAGFPEMIALNQLLPGATIGFRASSSAAQQAAAAAGLGLAFLHVFAAKDDDRLVQLMPDEMQLSRSYWLVMHADLQRLPRVRAVADFIGEVVRAARDRL
ncbi:MAG TPA: LysR family transcriptional regulator [Sphingobium sp.]|uniref:LysR family transcriptional regulator n=1 Tax=unclassified Sphingobium TaxID=2611147 RepID=UPI000EEF9605|nr:MULTISPECIES: LysR family transcriptional regulator [unclassified Sphingobium]WIW90756.1 LysR family transcriptional regulator [Sphingobium sp. V4]HAF43321.1 LysR family transcriptional regulator [Sphingobium sp.]